MAKQRKDDGKENDGIKGDGNVIPIALPTYDGRTVGITLLKIAEAIRLYNRVYGLSVAQTSSITACRSIALHQLIGLRDTLHKVDGVVRGFFIDSDIIWNGEGVDKENEVEKLVEVMRKADREHLNVIFPVRTISQGDINRINISRDGSRLLYVEEYNRMDDWDKIPYGGLAFYYGDLYLDYDWHFDTYGEDFNYIKDNKINPRIVKLNLGHPQKIVLQNT